MIARTLLCLTLAPLGALAQLQVYALSGVASCQSTVSSTQTLAAVGSSYLVGSAGLGETIHTLFRVKNMGTQTETLSISLAGEGFTIASGAAPFAGPGQESGFCVDFTPTLLGSYSATLQVNTIDITLIGSVAPSATVTLAGTTTPLRAGATVNFGSVVVRQTKQQGFILSNSYASPLTVRSVTVSGDGFSGPSGTSFPLQIGPGQSATFQVTFAPLTGSAYQGTLTVDGRVFALQGQGQDTPLPSASIILTSTLGASAQQNNLSISLSSASQVSGTGTLAMSFQSSVPGVSDDPAIEFLSGASRRATVTIAAGASSALIDGQQSIAFQTGTTAGTITFTLTLENGSSREADLLIPASDVVLDAESAVRKLGSIQVSLAGFDNTYSASQLAFTFYDISGKALPGGAINVNASADFQNYFSSGQAGGSFSVLATFPVQGNTNQIGYVSVQISNVSGVTTAQQIQILN